MARGLSLQVHSTNIVRYRFMKKHIKKKTTNKVFGDFSFLHRIRSTCIWPHAFCMKKFSHYVSWYIGSSKHFNTRLPMEWYFGRPLNVSLIDSRFLAKTLRVNKIAMKSFTKICRSESTLNCKSLKYWLWRLANLLWAENTRSIVV